MSVGELLTNFTLKLFIHIFFIFFFFNTIQLHNQLNIYFLAVTLLTNDCLFILIKFII